MLVCNWIALPLADTKTKDRNCSSVCAEEYRRLLQKIFNIFLECYIVIMVSITGGTSGGGKTLKELMAAATTLQSIAVQSIKVG